MKKKYFLLVAAVDGLVLTGLVPRPADCALGCDVCRLAVMEHIASECSTSLFAQLGSS